MPAGKTSFEKGGIQFNIGDQVLVQQAPHELHPFVAKIEKISVDQVNGGHELGITWYYRPEDTARRVSGAHQSRATASVVLRACRQEWQGLTRRRCRRHRCPLSLLRSRTMASASCSCPTTRTPSTPRPS